MPIDNREQLRAIQTFPSLVKYLRDELDWPISTDSFEELTFDYSPEELGIDAQNAAKIQEIKRMRPLSAYQPWGIFFVKFEPKKLPVVALRRILSRVVLKKRASANHAERAAWAPEDLLFISSYGEEEERRINFAHFAEDPEAAGLPTLKVLGWDNLDTPLHLDHAADTLARSLKWPDDDEDLDGWRQSWRSAFVLRHKEVITTSRDLSVRLAELARTIRDRIKSALSVETQDGPLTKLMKAFQEALVHDLDADGFADMYAQTIAYGLLSARIADPKSRTRDDLAARMRTNPFLKELMQTFLQVGERSVTPSGSDIDFDELGVSEVVELLDYAQMEAVLRDFGDRNPQEDPVIHFYELFLKEFDSKKRMQRGVFYTPRPVVSYIVRSIDELLRSEFGLEDGLADTTTWGQMANRHEGLRIPAGVSPDQAFVQILDPATGTGTFLVEVIDLIYRTLTRKWEGEAGGPLLADVQRRWNDYVPRHLLTRLHGYELLMAPYAIAHLKLGLKLHETGYLFGSDMRAQVYLTNTLEPAQDFSDRLQFAIPALAHEARAVNTIKRGRCFTVVMGNPPYSVSSQNRSPFIEGLMDLYKLDVRHEPNLKPLSDDYVKFLRYMQFLIAKTGLGIGALITNNSFLWGPTFAGVRKRLMTDFQAAHLLDLHGDSLAGENAPTGERDENVFDIRQGVAIGLYVRNGDIPEGRGEVSVSDIYGPRAFKSGYLSKHSVLSTPWTALNPSGGSSTFLQPTQNETPEYANFFSVRDVFPLSGKPVITKRDSITIHFERESLVRTLDDLRDLSKEDFTKKYAVEPDSRDWTLEGAQRAVRDYGVVDRYLRTICYRPFDLRWTYYVPKTKGFMAYPTHNLLRHMLAPNLALCLPRQIGSLPWKHALVAGGLVEFCFISNRTREQNDVYPLYTYQAVSGQERLGVGDNREPNLDQRFCSQLAERLNLTTSRTGALPAEITPENLLHYLYAVLNSPQYRTRYADSLRFDAPRIPIPHSLGLFRKLAGLGEQIVELHLLDGVQPRAGLAEWRGTRGAVIREITRCGDAVWIAKKSTEGFEPIPSEVWEFKIGSYQVCAKWLKDRKGRTLSDADIAHYQKIVVALSETIRIMGEIDEVIERHGGWPGAFQTGGEPGNA